MANKILANLGKNIILILALIWGLLWILPWASWLDPLPWMLMGISIVMYIVPGMAISLFLAGERFSLPSHSISGLAISVLLVGVLGLLGRIIHLPFTFIKPVFVLIGLIALLVLFMHARSGHSLYKPKRFSIVTLIFLLLMVVFGILVTLQGRFGVDDFSYLAYVTNWQHAQSLNFAEVFFGSGNLDSIRFWLAMFPMSLALMAEVSHLHGLLLIGLYLEPSIMVIAILAAYNLYEDLLQSDPQTIAAVLLQFTFLFLLRKNNQDPGTAFFNRLSEDKVFAAFVLAPVFFLATRYFIESFTVRSGIFVILIGLGLGLTHPVILAYAIFIAGVYGVIMTTSRRNFKRLGITLALLLIVILPMASLRFVKTHGEAGFNLGAALKTGHIDRRISYIKGTPFYGFNLERIEIQTNNTNQEKPLQAFFSLSYLWILGLGFVWSLFNLKSNPSAPFITATALLVIVCAIPYTGWLVGYFVSARMLWRSPWLLPIGLIGVVLLADLLKFTLRKASAISLPKISSDWVLFPLISVVCFILIGYFSTQDYGPDWQALAELRDYRISLETYSMLGDYLEKNIEQPAVFLARNRLMDYLPGLSSKSKPVFFRSSIFTHSPVDQSEINQIFSSDASISMMQRVNIIKKYHVEYVLVQGAILGNYYTNNGSEYFNSQKIGIGHYWLLEFLGERLIRNNSIR